jgi:DNA processing protein
MPHGTSATDLLLRLSTVEGFHVGHLRRLGGAALPDASPPSPSLLRKGEDAASSREAGERAERIRESCRRSGIRIVPVGSPDYPPLLAEIPDAPIVLYRLGAGAVAGCAVAVVGSRAPTAPGRSFARELSADLAESGAAVVSGMARGIDASAHEGALEGGGTTVAVLGCGVDVVYPPESRALRDRIAARGEVLSEYPPGTAPAAWRFPARNRIVSGMCRAVVVAEAARRSGALITARLALEQGREVLAVPGSPWFPQTAGGNALLRDGAAPATCAADVLRAAGREPAPDPSTPEGRVLLALRRRRTPDRLSAALGMPVPQLLQLLFRLERMNFVRKEAGNWYIRVSV